MSIWASIINNWTPVAVADATNFTNAGYHALQNNVSGGATDRSNISKITLEGLASSSSPAQMIIARDSTVGATSLSGAIQTSFDAIAVALANAPVGFNTSTTKPQRSSTLQLLTAAFNAFGGQFTWQANKDAENISIVGHTASLGEISISSASGGTPGLMASNIVYEPL